MINKAIHKIFGKLLPEQVFWKGSRLSRKVSGFLYGIVVKERFLCLEIMERVKKTEHLKKRIRTRGIPEDYPDLIYENPDKRFFDNSEGHDIAVKKLDYNGKERNMMIAYEEGEVTEIITIHPISDNQIRNRVERGRWQKR